MKHSEIRHFSNYCDKNETLTAGLEPAIFRLEATRAFKKETLLGGLEPPTSRLTAERASQLRHKSYFLIFYGFSQLLLKSNWFYLIDTMIDMDRISIKNLI
ncbi:hypothetical protein H8356DRAFT_1325534 [Neocallimastix lanati (nom. inval.)]|nr:hypothetical protein H8356DRAFT_1325534 [Neocallimastix sp. JGI-2020a]